MEQDAAELIAINVLTFLVGDEKRLERFLSLSGNSAESLAAGASQPAFLAGILEYILQDETLVYLFATEFDMPPDAPEKARKVLSGGREFGDYS